jgi:hypothetical protein
MNVFGKSSTFSLTTPLSAPTVYVARVAESALHHNRVSHVAFTPRPAVMSDRHVTVGEWADYDTLAAHLRKAGYTPGSSKANSSRAKADSISTLTEVWSKEE